jgi:hypothetical protein
MPAGTVGSTTAILIFFNRLVRTEDHEFVTELRLAEETRDGRPVARIERSRPGWDRTAAPISRKRSFRRASFIHRTAGAKRVGFRFISRGGVMIFRTENAAGHDPGGERGTCSSRALSKRVSRSESVPRFPWELG